MLGYNKLFFVLSDDKTPSKLFEYGSSINFYPLKLLLYEW